MEKVRLPKLNLSSDGIWYSSNQDSISYPEEGNAACLEVEDHSFCFRHRNACIVEMVQNFPPAGKDADL
jgi:hypothetical protein